MNRKLRFFIVDVFGEKKYTGNQLAVFLCGRELDSGEMQRIAREINFSETTFIVSPERKSDGFEVRIFTPGKEVDFAGHPTLGTAFIIRKYIIRAPARKVTLRLRAGRVPVLFPEVRGGNQILWMHQIAPSFGKKLDAAPLARLLGLKLDDVDTRFPAEEVSTGLPFIIVPLKSLGALKRATVDKKFYFNYVRDAWAQGILVFSPEGHNKGHDLAVRVFVDCYGIPEDPATGSGNGCLAAYLVKNRYFGTDSIDIKTGQGYEIGRPSLLYLRAAVKKSQIKVAVGGQVTPIAAGWWG